MYPASAARSPLKNEGRGRPAPVTLSFSFVTTRRKSAAASVVTLAGTQGRLRVALQVFVRSAPTCV